MAESRSKSDTSLVDVLLAFVSPFLIVVMVSSLVTFLILVFYSGSFTTRMEWTSFFFVLGTVGVARLSIMGEATERYPLYALILGALTFFALSMFHEASGWIAPFSPFVNLFLVLIVAWSSFKLTWDCTHIDEETEAATRGMLEAAGLDSDSKPAPVLEKMKSKKRDVADAMMSWWQRYTQFAAAERKRHTPGTWVVYYSLAAFPLFGIGQACISPEQSEVRYRAFWLMTYYLASGLGLLLNTSFVNLRRYLHSRKAKMPDELIKWWLGTGAAIIIGCLLVGSLLPRPYAEFSLLPLPKSMPELSPSSWAPWKSAPATKEGDSSSKAPKASPEGEDKQPGSGGEPGQGKGGQEQKGSDSAGSEGKSKSDDAQESKSGAKEEDRDTPSSGERGEKQRSEDASKWMREIDTGKWLGWLVDLIRWVAVALAVLLTVGAFAYAGLRYLSNFTHWAARFLEWLHALWQRFGRRSTKSDDAVQPDTPAPPRKPRFSDFENPFEGDGRPDSAEVVYYTFEALSAWANDRKLDKLPKETSLEFTERLREKCGFLDPELLRFNEVFTQVAYAKNVQSLSPQDFSNVRRLWRTLEKYRNESGRD